MANPLYGSNSADDKLDGARMGSNGGYRDVGADVTLTAEDAGVITFTSNGIDITLPAHQKGLTYHFIQTGDYATAACQVLSADGNDWLGAINAVTGVGDASALTDDKGIWGSGTLAGDSIYIVSNG